VCAKEAVVLTPSASSTSALPAREVTAREPCLATGRPAPAMTKAAAVETLKVFAGLDPVPAVSMKRAWRDDNGTARARIAAAMPASSRADSPFTDTAASAAAICASVASGWRSACKNSPASFRVRCSPCIKRDVISRSATSPIVSSSFIWRNSAAGQGQRLHHCPRFVDCFLVFKARVGISHNSSASLKVGFALLEHDGSQDDAGIDIAIEPEITDCARVTTTPGFFQLADDLHRPDLWRTRYRAGGEAFLYTVEDMSHSAK